mmetsp:Transcript_35781/g.50700  ORF Transcript_35781/g.50700 Transcript_35781/m.50700 type:complete len:95 (-) Transcript_35781:470-754(-)
MDDLSVMQHVTLLLDGLSRAAIIPFGPTLVLKLLRLSTNNDNTTDGNSSTSNADRDTTDIDMNINMEAAEQQQLQQTIKFPPSTAFKKRLDRVV